MNDLTAWGLGSATADERLAAASCIVDQVWSQVRPAGVALVVELLAGSVNPQRFLAFELAVVTFVRELGRLLMQATLNTLEPQSPDSLPCDLWWEAGGYRRRTKKTPRRSVATLCGTITLWRRGYRSWDRNERSIFPLEMLLGLNCGVTPGLTDALGRTMAESGATQSRVLQQLRERHGVSMGVKRLRAVTAALSQGLAEFRQASQVDVLLAALAQAQQSRGSRKPVLAVGRDGITLREYRHRFFEVATAATISIYDRAGRRLTTVYLAWPPQLGQATMDRMLTELLHELLDRWHGPLPQLAYITDAGDSECRYYQHTLRRMLHPRTGRRLSWQRVVDYYHVSERIWTMASLLLGPDTCQSQAWARRMLKLLKKPGGVSRVLHSAAGLVHRRKLKAAALKDFWKAYRYLQKRTRYLRYHDYAKRHIPLGSGVTEAACKTVFTQRMKLSGMRWTHDGAATILNLRVILLSGSWNATFSRYLESLQPAQLRPYVPNGKQPLQIAA